MPHSATGYGEIRIGRFYVVEMEKLTESTDGKMSLTGQESSPPATGPLVTFIHGQIAGMQEGHLVPVTFRDKAERNGYYAVSSASSDLTDYQSEVVSADWQIELQRQGSPAEVDLQSRLTGAVRQNDFALSGTRWHAPAINHYGYHTGTSNPSGSVTRTSSDGALKVYLGIPASIHPKWGCGVADYYGGRVRITDTLEVATENEVEGINRQLSASGWSLSNGVINATPTASAGVINVQFYNGTAWQNNYWKLQVGGVNIAAFSAVNILRNDFEHCILRLTVSTSSGGRTTVDLSLRRGSRFVEGYMQNSTSATLKVAPNNVTPGTSGTGYQTASFGTHRFAAGSARTMVFDNTNGGISKASTTTFDFWVGVVVNGSTYNLNPTFDTNVNNWSGANTTIARSTAIVHPQAVASMLITPSGGISSVSARSDLTGVGTIVPGQQYRISGWFYSPAGWNGLYPSAQWADSGGSILSSSGTTRNVSAGTWTFLEDTVTAPASTSQVRMTARADNTPTSSDIYYVWDLRISNVVATGDGATDLRDQYIAAMPEIVYAVKR